jgi:CRP-like cAMP-binding protein
VTTQALFGQETDIERLPLGPRRRSSGATVSCAGPGSNPPPVWMTPPRAIGPQTFDPISGGRGGSHGKLASQYRIKDARAHPELLEACIPRVQGTVVAYAPGQEVVGDGDPTVNFFLVIDGLFRAERFTADGRRQVFAFYMAGDLCGLEPHGTHKMTIEAQDRATMAILPRRLCQLRMDDHPEFGAALFDGATRALALTVDHIMMIGRSSAEERLAWFLTMLADRSAAGSAVVVDLRMQRQDIADYLGLTIETVSRTFTRFKDLGLINLSHVRRVHILRPDALARLAAADRDAVPTDLERSGRELESVA